MTLVTAAWHSCVADVVAALLLLQDHHCELLIAVHLSYAAQAGAQTAVQHL